MSLGENAGTKICEPHMPMPCGLGSSYQLRSKAPREMLEGDAQRVGEELEAVGIWALRAMKGNSDGAGNSDVAGT